MASIPAMTGLYIRFVQGSTRSSLVLLLMSAFCLRLFMISLDPYLHEWDERFHALVSRNMIDHPFRPVLFRTHIMEFNPKDWAYLHVWVHKQPLFLWIMALSMKIFGVSEFAVRLPSAIMGTVMVFFIYDISRLWFKKEVIGYIAAFMSTFSFYTLELTTGRFSLDHNDLAFTFFVTSSIWAFLKYLDADKKWPWIVLIGVFSGSAILTKWLTGLLIFGGWGLYTLLSESRSSLNKYVEILVSALIACAVFVPWQMYIMNAFPVESHNAYASNVEHMTHDLAHPGNVFFHVTFLSTAYHPLLLVFFIIGLAGIFLSKSIDRSLTIAMVAMAIVLFSFFSLLVATKMPAFVFPAASILFSIMAYGLYWSMTSMGNYVKFQPLYSGYILALSLSIIGFLTIKHRDIIEYRSDQNVMRNNKIHNTEIFKHLHDDIDSSYVLLNTRPYENIELMFYNDHLAYHWYPSPAVLDSLQNLGHKFAAFEYENDQQSLPQYITADPEITILTPRLK
jgi:4-amino-4-deoxy-L-arabinose transferase